MSVQENYLDRPENYSEVVSQIELYGPVSILNCYFYALGKVIINEDTNYAKDLPKIERGLIERVFEERELVARLILEGGDKHKGDDNLENLWIAMKANERLISSKKLLD